MDQRLLRVAWLSGFGVAMAAPALAYLALPSNGGLSTGGFWNRLSVLTGLLALSALVSAAVEKRLVPAAALPHPPAGDDRGP